jgi:hypothetical protein
MSGTPRENAKGKGFWDGGVEGHDKSGETSGRASGYPGVRKPSRVGIRTDIEFPAENAEPKTK